ncbi:MAG: HAD-IC family P-type ATPase [Ilumatobacteraceae bacterium]
MSERVAIDETYAGLTSAEVAERRAAGLVNEVDERSSRSYGEIVRSHIFTRFNAIIAVLGGVIFAVGDPIDALFVIVAVLNTVIGIVQESRAKRTLDSLRVLIAPTITVVRDGADVEIDASEIVADDLVRLSAGDQVPVDGVVIDVQALEVDESALTGEADPIPKHVEHEVRSGSAVVAGAASIVATGVGADAWVRGLEAQAKEFVLTKSELRSGVDQILRIVTWIIVPVSALLLWSQLRSGDDVSQALVSSVAGVVGLVPQGLVLLTSMALAVGIMRLARNNVVVQELYALEGLARIDVLCVDKTGTLTTGQFTVDEVTIVGGGDGDESLRAGLAAMAAAEVSPTASTRVIADHLGDDPGWTADQHVAFSSARKWSGTTFAGHGTWLLGAPEVLLDAAVTGLDDESAEGVDTAAADAKRVLLVARSDEPLGDEAVLPSGLRPVGYVVLAEELRSDAAEIMEYFRRQGVAVKIISGDNPDTVSAVGQRLGVRGAEDAIDLRTLDDDELAGLVEDTTVFGRVLPEQKRALVDALQETGHTVAMTGDGVNDIPALKRADIGIAMDTATAATKAVSQLVLLDGRFDRLPDVVAEGRRVVANMERVSALFVTKTVYATLIALAIGFSGAIFPFLPRHMSLVSTFTIGIPAFILSFRAADAPCKPGYLERVLRFAVPAGTVAAVVSLTTYWFAQSALVDASLAEARTASTFALTSTAFWILYRLMRPIDRFDLVLLVALIAGFLVVLAVPPIADFFALDWPPPIGVAGMVVISLGSIAALEIALRWAHPQDWNWLTRLARAG